ncbi:MAG: hypothetical protein EZS28_018488 [Streblomastix strix]|uniref:Uncharacterized protein n=1 Tax=Streblomastix strix TaxID=222440 RepID=A0A5J4VUX6_9EUKA|nr:MAG: hypothetical protein EZS28_018488 [Streblomastix strix]
MALVFDPDQSQSQVTAGSQPDSIILRSSRHMATLERGSNFLADSARRNDPERLIIRTGQGHFDPESHQSSDADFWGFEPESDMQLWTACILAEAALMKAKRLQDGVAKSRSAPTTPHRDIGSTSEVDVSRPMIAVKRKRPDEAAFLDDSNISWQYSFNQERQRVDKFNSIEEQKIAQGVSTLLAGIVKQDSAKIDNVVFPVLEAQAALPEEKAGLSRRALESICPVTQRLAGIIHDIARKNTNKIVNKLTKVWEASLVSVSDSYKERQSRLRGLHQGLSTEDILSKTSKEKFKQKKNTKSVSSHNPTNYCQQFNWMIILIPEQGSLELASFTSPIITPQISIQISPKKHRTNTHQMEMNGHNLTNILTPEYSYQSYENVQSPQDLTLCNSIAHYTDLSLSNQVNQSSQSLPSLIYDPPTLLKIDLNNTRIINQVRIMDHRAKQIKLPQPGRTMSHLNKTGEELQKLKEWMSDPMNLVAASFISNKTPQQDQEKQKQIKESHIMSMQTLIGTERILQQTTHSPSPLYERNISPTLLYPHFYDLPVGGKLSHYVSEWQMIGADTLISRGIKPFWLYKECSEILTRGQMHSFIKQIKVKFGSFGGSDSKRVTGRYNRGGAAIRSKMDKPMLRDSEGKAMEIAKKTQIIPFKTSF